MKDNSKLVLFLVIGLVVGLIVGSTVFSITGNAVAEKRGGFLSIFGGKDAEVKLKGNFSIEKEIFELDTYVSFNEYIGENYDVLSVPELRDAVKIQASMLDQLAAEVAILGSLVTNEAGSGDGEGPGCDAEVMEWCLRQVDDQGESLCWWDDSDCSCHC